MGVLFRCIAFGRYLVKNQVLVTGDPLKLGYLETKNKENVIKVSERCNYVLLSIYLGHIAFSRCENGIDFAKHDNLTLHAFHLVLSCPQSCRYSLPL